MNRHKSVYKSFGGSSVIIAFAEMPWLMLGSGSTHYFQISTDAESDIYCSLYYSPLVRRECKLYFETLYIHALCIKYNLGSD